MACRRTGGRDLVPAPVAGHMTRLRQTDEVVGSELAADPCGLRHFGRPECAACLDYLEHAGPEVAVLPMLLVEDVPLGLRTRIGGIVPRPVSDFLLADRAAPVEHVEVVAYLAHTHRDGAGDGAQVVSG